MDLHIGIMTDFLNPSIGGHSKNIGELGNALEVQGCQVTYITQDRSVQKDSRVLLIRSSRPSFIGPSLEATRVAQKVERDIDVFHGNICYGFPYRFLGSKEYVPHLRASHKSTVRSIRNDETWKEGYRTMRTLRTMSLLLLMQRIECATCRRSRIVIANSPETARAASADLRIDLSRFRVIPNGVVIPTVPQDSSNVRKKFGIRADDVVVLCVSRLSFTKGVERLVESAKTVIRRRKNVYYILVGSGEIEARIRESVRLNGMEDRFFLAGSVENDQLHEYYSAADLFVVPTSPGTTLLEAMSYGKPFIVYTLAGDLPAGVSVAEIERRNVGIVLRDVSLDSLSRVIVDIVDDENWRIVMGARCKEYVQSELSWPKVASAMISVYRELIEGVI